LLRVLLNKHCQVGENYLREGGQICVCVMEGGGRGGGARRRGEG